MNKNEKEYKRSFNTLHLSEDFSERLEARLNDEREENKMNSNTLHGFSRIAAAITACAVTLGVGGVCYAADLGGIRTRVELWMNGEKTEVEVDEDGMGYSWTDEDGEEYGFGGVTVDEDGNEVAMTAEELAEVWNTGCEIKASDGRLNLSYKNLSYDVTDMVNEDGTLRVHIADPLNPYTYFGFENITPDGSYGAYSLDQPEPGAEYIELDAAGLSTEGEAVTRPDNECVGTYTTISED
ncbi:MAG: hypothetical protein IKR23_09280 [Lachnospiraceae bacterium]|nr:hypothetical protein [Lachnospiraceae bacterium]